MKATVTFLGHTSQLLDVYVSFSRQAAQAMSIRASKTIFPIQNTPQVRFAPPEVSTNPHDMKISAEMAESDNIAQR